MAPKYVVMIQCDIVHNRCSGYACTQSFYDRAHPFAEYPEDTRYISFTCGGCCGKSTTAKLGHFKKKLKTKLGLTPDNVVVHLSSCMTTDNTHSDRCPHIDFIKDIIRKRGFNNIVEGTYISKGSSKKREMGLYKSY